MSRSDITERVVGYVVSQIVSKPEAVRLDVVEQGPEDVVVEVTTARGDMGRVIGRRGRVAQGHPHPRPSCSRRGRAPGGSRIPRRVEAMGQPVTVGRLGRPHGLNGELALFPDTDNPQRFVAGARLHRGDTAAASAHGRRRPPPSRSDAGQLRRRGDHHRSRGPGERRAHHRGRPASAAGGRGVLASGPASGSRLTPATAGWSAASST